MAFSEILTLYSKTEQSAGHSLKKQTKTPVAAARTLSYLATFPAWERIDYVAPDGTKDSIVPEQLCCERKEEIPDVEQIIFDLAMILPGSEQVTIVFKQPADGQVNN